MQSGVALGLGCDRGTPFATLYEAIEQALALAGVGWDQVQAMASIDLKVDEAAMQQLMAERGMPIRFHPAAELAQVKVPNPSEVVRKYTGTPSVSEAAALLAAGQVGAEKFPIPGVPHPNAAPMIPAAPMSALLVEKHKLRGPDGRNATVSVARVMRSVAGSSSS